MEKVRERLLRVTRILGEAGVPYAVAGGNAVAAWVSTVDESAVRNTRDVDVLIRREDLAAARAAMEGAGFVYRHSAGVDLFLEDPEGSARDAVHIVIAGEKVREHEPAANPDVSEYEEAADFRVLSLPALVQIKLTAFRDKDRVHLRDLIDVGLVDESWCERFEPILGERLRTLLETPDG